MDADAQMEANLAKWLARQPARVAASLPGGGMKLAFVLALLLTACAAPPVSPVATPEPSKPLGRVLFKADVEDWVLVCVEPTAAMRMIRPTADTMICGATVGDLRAQFIRQWSAN